MAALTAVIPTNTGTVTTPAAVAASDTVAQSLLGKGGAYLWINNGGGSTDNVTISDNGLTPAGNALTSNQVTDSITTLQSQVYWLRNEQVNPTTGLITITHSFITTVTYLLYPLP